MYKISGRKDLIGITVIFLTLMFFSAFFAINAEAAEGAKLSKKKLTLPVGAEYKIKAKRTGNTRVKWSSSNKKVVKIGKKSGKNNSAVTLVAKKKGTAYIKARIGRKTLKCKVVIKNADYKTASSIFAFKILKESISEDKAKGKKQNILVSPDSIATALAMVELGANGKTLKEMEAVLGGGIKANDFNRQLSDMHNRIQSNSDASYSLANSIWIRKNLITVNENFIDANKQYHNAQIFEEAFDNETVDKVNTWVSDNTKGRIDKIIDGFDKSARAVLINALSFDGEWQKPFDTSVEGVFTRANGSKESASMLYDTSGYQYFELNGGKAFAKEYKGSDSQNGNIAFVGILPPKGKSVDSYLNSIDGYDYIKAWNKKKITSVDIGMPKFKYEYEARLANPLKRMGMKTAFSKNADFGRMIAPASFTRRICIDDVIHKTYIETDENGTKAAAATAVEMKSISHIDGIKIHLNRPFIYLLVDTKTGIPLFIGVLRSIN